jgi:hypothetical protein
MDPPTLNSVLAGGLCVVSCFNGLTTSQPSNTVEILVRGFFDQLFHLNCESETRKRNAAFRNSSSAVKLQHLPNARNKLGQPP